MSGWLVTLLLPLFDNEGRRFGDEAFGAVRRELTERFGGLTAYARAPAEGVWRDAGRTQRDDVVVLEVMAEDFGRAWWSAYRSELEARFRQEVIVIRAQPYETV